MSSLAMSIISKLVFTNLVYFIFESQVQLVGKNKPRVSTSLLLVIGLTTAFACFLFSALEGTMHGQTLTVLYYLQAATLVLAATYAETITEEETYYEN